MTFSLLESIAHDCLLVDGLQTFSFTSRPGGSPFTVAGVQGVVQSQSQIAASATLGVEPTDIVLGLPGVNMGDVVPKNGDLLTDADSMDYTLQAVMGFNNIADVWLVAVRKAP